MSDMIQYAMTKEEFSAFGYNVHGMHHVDANRLVFIHGRTNTKPESVIFSLADRPLVKLKAMPLYFNIREN